MLELPNITIQAIVKELKILENKKLRKIQEITNNFYKFRFNKEQLIVSDKVVYLTEKSIPAKQTSSGFGAYLNKQLSDTLLKEVKQHKNERIIILDFGEKKLILELFSKGNIILVDKENNILSAYKKQDFGKRTLKKEKEYIFPPEKNSPLEISLNKEEVILKQLIKEYNIYPLVFEIAAKKCKVNLKEKAGKENTICLEKEIKEIYKKDYKIFQIIENTLSPVFNFSEQENKDKEKKTIEDRAKEKGKLMDILDNYISPKIKIEKKEGKKKKALEKSFEEMLEKENEFKKREIEDKEKAEKIYENYTKINEIIKAVNKGLEKKIDKKEIVKKIKNKIKEVKDIDFKEKKIILEI